MSEPAAVDEEMAPLPAVPIAERAVSIAEPVASIAESEMSVVADEPAPPPAEPPRAVEPVMAVEPALPDEPAAAPESESAEEPVPTPKTTTVRRPISATLRVDPGGRGVTARGVVVLILVLTGLVGIAEIASGGHRGHLFGVVFALTSAAAAFVVRPRDLRVAMIAPPLLYCVLIAALSVIDTRGSTGGFASREALYIATAFVTGAPAMWSGTALAVAIGWFRLRSLRAKAAAADAPPA